MSQHGLREASTPWSHIPTSLLHNELQRRQQTGERPECGSGKDTHEYNVGIHVFALFLILTLSTLACGFPVVVRRFPKLPVPKTALFFSRHFGTGVLIATAFVHLLPTAYVSLTDPCLPRFWNDVYPAMAGFVAMVSVLVVVAVEQFFAIKGASHSHHIDFDHLRDAEVETRQPPSHRRSGSFRRFKLQPVRSSEDDEEHTSLYLDSPELAHKPLPEPPAVGNIEDDDIIAGEDFDLELDDMDPVSDDAQPLTGGSATKGQTSLNGNLRPERQSRQVSFADLAPDAPHDTVPASPAANEQRAVLQCLLLEAGILFHSVFIGMALSVSTGPAFAVLLVAISFHQTFEGLALGSRIAAISSFSTSSLKPWLMSLMYGITTPIGQAIGLAVQGLYDPHSQVGLLMVGIVNAISSGLLLYAGLVQLLAEDFLSEHSYVELFGMRRVQACAAVVGGSILMAFVGAFA